MTRRHSARSSRPSRPPRADGEARKQARRAELVDAAVRVIRRDGPGVPMDAIAAEAGVTKPILYRHFGDRRGLVDAVAEQFASDLMTGLAKSLATPTESPRSILVATVDGYLAFVERDRELYRFLVHQAALEDAGTAARLGGFIREVSQRVAVVLHEQLKAVGADTGGAEPIAYGIVGMVHAAGDWWIEARSMSRARLVDYLATLLWSGLETMASGDEIDGATGAGPAATRKAATRKGSA